MELIYWSPFEKKITPVDVEKLINFGVAGSSDAIKTMHVLQTGGVAGIWNILCRQDFAYLADEVGMGKTYQALGLITLLWNFKPDAKVVIICPRANLQTKWKRDYDHFIENNYRGAFKEQGDDRVKSILLGEPAVKGRICENLRDFARGMLSRERQLNILRHTSFMRPVFIVEKDIKNPWEAWEREKHKMQLCGLSPVDRKQDTIERLSDLSGTFNEWFAEAFNKMLGCLPDCDDGKAIDLLIVDESQYLRNENQTNNVLYTLFKDRVKKWLFMSATPVHSGRKNIQRVINKYVKDGFISDEDRESVDRLRDKMQSFMIRRPREYSVNEGKHSVPWPKSQYRAHLHEESRILNLTPLESLTMAVVQKKLVEILDGRNNRFKIGCLSSFESLQASVYNEKRRAAEDSGDEEPVAGSGPQEHRESDLYVAKVDAHGSNIREIKDLPDMLFVEKFAQRYFNKYGEKIPHPKVDFVVQQVEDKTLQQNEKIIVFTRRINSVKELVERLTTAHERRVIKHVRDAWGRDLHEIASVKKTGTEEYQATTDPEEELGEIEGDGILVEAHRKGKWLHRYRQTFRESGRNSLMFEENWFEHISRMYGVPLESMAARIPDDIWAESNTFASRKDKTKNLKLLPALRYQYLLVQTVKRYPELLGMDDKAARYWQAFFATRYENAKTKVPKDQLVRRNVQLIIFKGFWNIVQEKSRDTISLEGQKAAEVFGRLDEMLVINDEKKMLRREVAKNCIWQSIKLSDALIDLYCADLKGNNKNNMAGACLRYVAYVLESEYASALRSQIKSWLELVEVIIANCFGGDNANLLDLAAREHYQELRNPHYAVGITGGTPNKTALSQFKTPGHPRVIVCTDILKEGEDLHLFCDDVMHYGVAWTSGDLEQRVGRVDRYFSLIERRLSTSIDPSQVKLDIYYPHITNSLERYQIERVLDRVKEAEQILDDIDVERSVESKEIEIGWSGTKVTKDQVTTARYYRPDFTGIKSQKLPFRDNNEIIIQQKRLRKLYEGIQNILEKDGYVFKAIHSDMYARMISKNKSSEELIYKWEFVPFMEGYSIKIARKIDLQ